MKEMNLDITSEFLVMASTLVYMKSKSLLPNEVDDESELTEAELIRRIIEYKKYKEITVKLRERYNIYSRVFYKFPDKIELENRKVEEEYDKKVLIDLYKAILEKLESKINKNAINLEKFAISETITVSSKVKDIFRELFKKPKFVFNKMCTNKRYTRGETIVAFTGLLELTRRNKVKANQPKIFGDITVAKYKK
jgi:segregation and condensation protein A